MKTNEKNAVDRGFVKLSESLEKAARRQEQLDLLVEFCGDDQSEFDEALALLEARWRAEDGLTDAKQPMTENFDGDLAEDDEETDKAVPTLMTIVLEAERSSSTPTPAELAATDDNVVELSAFRNKKKPVIVPSFEPGWEAELRTGTYARSHSSEADGGWFPSKGNDKIKARGDRHRADFTWVGKGLEAEGVLLFVDGVRIEHVEVDLRADTNAMRLFFVLPDHIGDDVPLDRAETCLEDDGSVRIQLWTKK